MNGKSLSDAAGSVLARWRGTIVERFTGHPFPARIPAPLVLVNARGELTPEALQQLDERQFELLVTGFFAAVGFRADVASADQGAGKPMYLFRGDNPRPFGLVQRQWHRFRVGVRFVEELQAALAAEGLAEGYIVARDSFTSEARAYDTGRKVMLLDGQDLVLRINRVSRPMRAALLAALQKPADAAQTAA